MKHNPIKLISIVIIAAAFAAQIWVGSRQFIGRLGRDRQAKGAAISTAVGMAVPLSPRARLQPENDSLRPMAFAQKRPVDPTADAFTQVVQSVFSKRGYAVASVPFSTIGTFGIIYKAKEIATGRIVVIKVPRSYQFGYFEHIKSEFELWRKHNLFNHNFSALVRLYDAGFIPAPEMRRCATMYNAELWNTLEEDYPYQIMEFIDGDDLLSLELGGLLKIADFNVLIDSLLELADGIIEIHKAGLAYNDLREWNVVRHRTVAKLKICDLDPISELTEEKKNKDYRLFSCMCHRVLQVIAVPSPYEKEVLDFYSQWQPDIVKKKGLMAFAEALKQLKAKLSGVRPALNEIHRAPEADI